MNWRFIQSRQESVINEFDLIWRRKSIHRHSKHALTADGAT